MNWLRALEGLQRRTIFLDSMRVANAACNDHVPRRVVLVATIQQRVSAGYPAAIPLCSTSADGRELGRMVPPALPAR